MQQEVAPKTSVEMWTDLHRSVQWGTCPEPAVARWAMRRWGGQVKDAMGSVRLFEVGCGVGAMAVWLGNHGFLVDAMDVEPAIERARQHMPNHLAHSVKFYAGALPDSGFGREKYDGVVDVCCLQHVDRLDESVVEIHRVLKPGGALLSIFACNDHDPVVRDDLKGATFTRLGMTGVYRTFPSMLFSKVSVESMTHTDDGKNISHWIIEATK
jgi:SAM-dependent methyltransferase